MLKCLLFAILQRITVPEIIENEWFKKGYQPPTFDTSEVTNLDDVNAIFDNSMVISFDTFVVSKTLWQKWVSCNVAPGTRKSRRWEKRRAASYDECIWAYFHISGSQSWYSIWKTNGMLWKFMLYILCNLEMETCFWLWEMKSHAG